MSAYAPSVLHLTRRVTNRARKESFLDCDLSFANSLELSAEETATKLQCESFSCMHSSIDLALTNNLDFLTWK